jgi:hypothetical protein
MTLRSRLGVAAGVVIAVLLAVGVLLPRIVRASLIQQVDQQLSAALPAAPVAACHPRARRGDRGGVE